MQFANSAPTVFITCSASVPTTTTNCRTPAAAYERIARTIAGTPLTGKHTFGVLSECIRVPLPAARMMVQGALGIRDMQFVQFQEKMRII